MKNNFFFLFLFFSVTAFSQDAKFSRIDAGKGLSQASVKCILQDSKGYMWFGTGDGLNRYDGYEMKIFRNNPSDTNSLSENNIECLFEDSKGILWIGTHGGLNAYNSALNRFTRFEHDNSNPNSINGNVIRTIYEDKQGIYWVGTPYGLNSFDGKKDFFEKFQRENESDTLALNGFQVETIYQDKKKRLWVCTYDGGINLFNREKKTFTSYSDLRTIPGLQQEYMNKIISLKEDEKGNFWLATDNGGLAEFDPESKKFLNRYTYSDKDKSVSDNRISSLAFDKKNILWLGTKSGGITCFDKDAKKFFYYRNNEYDLQSISSDDINCMYSDNEGNIWIGTGDGGVCVYFPNAAKFRHYHRDVTNEHAFLSNTVMAILQAKDGTVWLGTKSGGITLIDRVNNSLINYGDGSQNSALTAKNNGVLSLHEDGDGIIWVGTWGAGLKSFDKKTNKIENIFPSGAVTCIAEGVKDILWVGFFGGGNGLKQYNRAKKTFTQFTREQGLSSDEIYCVYEDKSENVWIGTNGGGLNVLNLKTGKIKIFQHSGKNSISDNQVNCIYDDGNGNLWIGTSIGLNKFNIRTEIWNAFYESNGLPSNYINGILKDKQSNLWISTNNGITRFNPNEENKEASAFKNFSEHDGLQGKEYNVGSFFQNEKTGEMFFGGINGFNSFFPNAISNNQHIPPVYITSFKKFGKDAELDTTMISKKIIELKYWESFISFEFVALDYIFPEKNKYSFTMEGLDHGWSPPATRRYVSYTNLPGGDYIFRVRASNSDGVWNETGTEIHIHVVPPWWKTNLFYVLCVIFSIAFVFGFIRIRTAAIQKEKKNLEKKISETTDEL